MSLVLLARSGVLAFLLFALTALTGLAPAHADADALGEHDALEEIVVTGRRLQPVKLALESASVSVLTREELERSGAHTLLDALRGQPGVNAYTSGGPGAQASVFLRGGTGKRVQVLLDGVRISDPLSGELDWGQLSTANIERVEILRGAQSTLFGADASGGVIQIFTRAPNATPTETPSVQLAFGGGTERAYNMDVQVREQRASGLRYAAHLSTQSVEAFSASRLQGSTFLSRREGERDGFRGRVAQGVLSFLLGEARAVLRARSQKNRGDFDSGFPPDPNDATSTYQNSAHHFSGALDFSARQTDHRVQISSLRQRRRDADDRFVSQSTQLRWTAEGALGAHRFLAGASYENVQGEQTPSYAILDHRVHRTGGFARAEFSWERAQWNLGVRHERHARSGNSTTWQTGLRIPLRENLALVASGGTAFRAPSLVELFACNSLSRTCSGNPDLKPERASSADFGLRAAATLGTTRLRGELRHFRQRYTNMIAFDSNFVNINVERARYRGVEMDLRADFEDFWLALQHTRIQASAANGGHVQRRNDTARLALGVQRGALTSELVLRWSGARKDFDNITFGTTVLPAYTLVHLNFRYRWSERAQVFLQLHNLLNEDYQEVQGFGTRSRSARASVRFDF